MSVYSDDFDEGEIKKSDLSDLKSQESHEANFAHNLDALKEEIKVLEADQLKNLESYSSFDTVELADDSSEDDLSFIKRRQADLKTRARSRPGVIKNLPRLKANTKQLQPYEVSKNYSFHSRNTQRKNFSVLKKELKSNENSFFYSRPKQIVSAVPTLKGAKKLQKKSERKTYREVRVFDSFDRDQEELGPDWKKSVLEMYVSSNLCEFNWEKEESLMTEEQILQNKGNFSVKVMSKTFMVLSKEMFYCGKFCSGTAKVELQRLLMARKGILSALKGIREREELLITILTLGKEAGSGLREMYSQYYELTKSILVYIQRLKDSVLGIKNFVYFGEDYEKKIKDDQNRIKKLGII